MMITAYTPCASMEYLNPLVFGNTGKTAIPPKNEEIYGDILQILASKPQENNQPIKQAPQIGTGRLLLGRLTKEQVDAINESGELPKNAKFKENMNGNIIITWNALDVTTGTHKLPVGYEVKNDIFGFTHVVREGTKNIFIK